ncbi:4-coumarate-CoA ligase-like protein [Setomelanomma holmii]|uniref:4-coumarate-CoA ligase-like protein n=1 Tax=Setomelanomma holmii TaxID=210430 RepID=A0A9P4HDG5_9PLEO|nr:4-coumarate-CoA ligase-like protein [Setomelanomma holmii]
MPILAKEYIPIATKDILSWIYDDLAYDQDTPIYIDANAPSHSISAAQAKTLIRKLVAGLQHEGIRPGDTVLAHSFNNLYYPILVLGIIACGGRFCGTNASYTTGELKHALASSQTKLIICDPDVLGDHIITATRATGISSSQILALDSAATPSTGEIKGFRSWRTLLDHGETDWVRFDDETTSRNTTAGLFFSSGTTGLPKATQLSHYNFIAEHVLAYESRPRAYEIRRLVALPMFHIATAPTTHISALKAGHVQAIMRRYEPSTYLTMIKKYNITDLTLVPPQVTSLLALALPAHDKSAKLASVRCVWGGGAPLDASTQARFQSLLPTSAPFTQIWAMTETTCFASLFDYPETDTTGSVGRFLPNIDVKLLDDAGNDITAPDAPGELAIRGPTVTRGYVGVPQERDFDAEGYFRTGDIMRFDDRTGLWYILDRKKDLIKVRGFQVAPAEVEGVLLAHPGVGDAAVIGVGSADGSSEMPRAYVVKKSGVELDEEGVKSWVGERLAKYKWLEGGIVFVEGLPKTASGKIIKRELRERAKIELGAKL